VLPWLEPQVRLLQLLQPLHLLHLLHQLHQFQLLLHQLLLLWLLP
jgi:hypothetical protein